jgi:Methyltransferase domain
MTCTICGAAARPWCTALVLKKHTVEYFLCERCGFVQTEKPYWLDEAYDRAINRCDVGLVQRNVTLARQTRSIITSFFNADGRFLDYGGGYGLLVRMMRDAGFDFYRYDKYCENIFAQDFEAGEGDSYELVTAFELFEHLADPLAGIEELLSYSRNLLFTTELLPPERPKPGDWWYYIPDYGQHVSFYSLKSLQVIADSYNLNLNSDGRSLHLLSEKKISPLFFRMALHPLTALISLRLRRRESLIGVDFRNISDKGLR